MQKLKSLWMFYALYPLIKKKKTKEEGAVIIGIVLMQGVAV